MASIAAGISVGGGLLLWFTKLLAARLIRQYDDRHSKHENALEKIADRFTVQIHDLELKLAKLEPLIASAISLRDDLKSAEGDIAVLEHKADEAKKDLNHAHNQIRVICKKLEH